MKNNSLYFGVSVLLVPLLIYILYRISMSDQRLIPISMIFLIGGAIFETRKLTQSWNATFKNALISFAISFTAFIPGKRERIYILEDHITSWPYFFIGMFLIVNIAVHEKKITAKLSEGITLLLSIAAIYWIVDFFENESVSTFEIMAFTVVGLFSLFSVFHAFTKTDLTNNHRFVLSLWSSLVFFLLAVDNIYRVYHNNSIENSDFVNGCLIAIQYFLLGVSSVYMLQNFFMLFGFLPGRGRFFNQQYFEDIKKLKINHIERFSAAQIRHFYSMIAMLLSALCFYFNYLYQLVPKHVMIWFVFVAFPLLINIYEKLLLPRNKQANL